MEVEVRTFEPRRVAYLRHAGPRADVGETWSRLMAWAGSKGLIRPDLTMIGVTHDDPDGAPEEIRFDTCIAVDASEEGDDDVQVGEIAGGEYAVAMHEGAPDRLLHTVDHVVNEWAPGSGRRVSTGPRVEIYRKSLLTTTPRDLRTEVCIPLEPLEPSSG